MFRDRLDLTEAVLMGIQRYANIVPDIVSRMSTNHDITVNGFTIPANTHVMPLFVELLKFSLPYYKRINPMCFAFTQGDYWGDGTTFRPEHFLGAEGRCVEDEHPLLYR